MSTEHPTKATQPADDTAETRSGAEEWVEGVASFWGRALVDAWRTVFPPREDYK